MKKLKVVLLMALGCFMLNPAFGQFDLISSELDISIYPEERQDKRTQEYDEYKCYKWSVNRTRIDPRDIEDRQYNDRRPSRPNTGPDGTVVGNAAGGALIGALIGGLSGNAKKGAKWGAIAGGAAGIGKKAAKDSQARRDYEDDRRRANSNRRYDNAQLNRFRKAFCACMDAKGYSARY